MKIEYQDGGTESRLVITSGIFGRQAHERLVEIMLTRVPQLRAESEGCLARTTVISGKTAYVLCAEVIAEENGYRVRVAL